MGAKPKLTLRPIPRKRARWESEVEGIIYYLSDLPSDTSTDVGAWAAKQSDYYRTRLDDLLRHPPQGVDILPWVRRLDRLTHAREVH